LSGQYDRALGAWDHFLKISPTDIVYASYNRARMYIYQKDYARAEAELARGFAFEPHHPNLRSYLAVIDFYKGDVDKAIEVTEDVLSKNPDLQSQKVFLASCYIVKGERDRAFDLIDTRAIETARADQDIAYRLATFHALAGRADEAIEWLERSIAMGNENYPWISGSPNWNALRDDPRFKAILATLKKKWEELVNAASP
jgi:tetratricopeptide (TPR) repeat protein